MPTAVDLLRVPITYDIVIGDFGRDASIDYLRFVSAREKKLIKTVLDPERLPFFDEYRRIMCTAIHDVAFYKATAIKRQTTSPGHLTQEILVGGGLTPMSREFIDRVAVAVGQEVVAALKRDHSRIRIAIPCNGLSELATQIATILRSELELSRLSQSYVGALSDAASLLSADVSVHTVPEAVLKQVSADRGGGQEKQLLLLGTKGARSAYEDLKHKYGISILDVEDVEQELINQAIVASIGDDPLEVDACRQRIQDVIVAPRDATVENLLVVEACTDFRLGLGISSLELFAKEMVDTCYELTAS